ncbi:protein kinase [Fulvimarina sp. MAC3]|uniref:protein kinase domain-containing protein n=1 Tax=Fulvimarina sp. MAC3 TaxID=3148887 RepID=UPI0031FC03F1
MSDNDRTRIIMPPASDSLAAGTQLNGIYEIDRKIASGGMGEVYRGHNIHTEEPVAIKAVLPDLARDETILGLFTKEARVLSRLSHDAIVRYHAFAIDPVLHRPYLAMEFVDGISLADLAVEGPLDGEDVRRLVIRLASGLYVAHSAGVIHRDLSPDNVILPNRRVDEAKLIDFGIAKSTQLGDKTLLGDKFAGKYNFVSPEQLGLFAGKITAQSDIYSLGLVAANALLGRAIDMSGSLVESIERRRVVPDLSEIAEPMRGVIEAMLIPEPENRLKDMAEVVYRLYDLAPAESAQGAGPQAARSSVIQSLTTGSLPPRSTLRTVSEVEAETASLPAAEPREDGDASPGDPSATPAAPIADPAENAAESPEAHAVPTADVGPGLETDGDHGDPDETTRESDDGRWKTSAAESASLAGDSRPQGAEEAPGDKPSGQRLDTWGSNPLPDGTTIAPRGMPFDGPRSVRTADELDERTTIAPRSSSAVDSNVSTDTEAASQDTGRDEDASDDFATSRSESPFPDPDSFGIERHEGGESPFGPYEPDEPATQTSFTDLQPKKSGSAFLPAVLTMLVLLGGGVGAAWFTGVFDTPDDSPTETASNSEPAEQPASSGETQGDPAEDDTPADVGDGQSAPTTTPDRPPEAGSAPANGETDNPPEPPEAPRRPAADPAQIDATSDRVAWIATFDGGDCFLALPTSITEEHAQITGFGLEAAPFERLMTAYEDRYGSEPDIGVRLIQNPQCAVLGLIKGLSEGDAPRPSFTLSDDLISANDALKGRLSHLGNRNLWLYLVGNDGVVYNLENIVTRNGGEASFNVRLGLQTEEPRPQLMVALTSNEEIAAAEITEYVLARQFFPALLEAIESRGIDASAAITYFRLQQ